MTTLHLLSGHATDTLSPAERGQLYRAALADQEIFDRLVEEESWRQIFSSPGVRHELLEALAEPVAPKRRRRRTVDGLRGWLGSLWVPRMPSLAMGTAAAALLALVMVPRWLELGVAGPVGPVEGPPPPSVATPSVATPSVATPSVATPSVATPSVAAPAAGEVPPFTAKGGPSAVLPKGDEREKFVAKSYGSPEISAGETEREKFVAKSYGGSPESTITDPRARQASPPAGFPDPGATRGLRPKSTGSDYLNISYTLELNQPEGPRRVPDTHAFRASDQFRLRLGVDFTAWLYLFNRASGDTVYSVLYPHTASDRDPLPPSQRDVLLPAGIWLTMDDSPEDEQLVLVVSALPWPPAGAGRETIPAGELDAALARAEGSFGSLSWRRSEVDDRVRLTVAEGEGAMVVVLRLLGQ